MAEMNQSTDLYWLIGILAVAFFVILLVGSVFFLNDFSRELKYLNNEIKRTEGAERAHWIRMRRRLWLSLFPFIRY